MKPEKFTIDVTLFNIIIVVLTAALCIVLVLGHERVCSVVCPDITRLYCEILKDKKQDFRDQKIGIGSRIRFQFSENKKSLGELYALKNIKFIPDNNNFPIWTGENKDKTWNENTGTMENMQRFRMKFNISVPKDKLLEGKTIKGILKLQLSYPVFINYTKKTIATRQENFKRPVSVHIFSRKKLDQLSILTNKMIKIWIICIILLVVPILFILIIKSPLIKSPPRVV
jgi:hypothetical protein